MCSISEGSGVVVFSDNLEVAAAVVVFCGVCETSPCASI